MPEQVIWFEYKKGPSRAPFCVRTKSGTLRVAKSVSRAYAKRRVRTQRPPELKVAFIDLPTVDLPKSMVVICVHSFMFQKSTEMIGRRRLAGVIFAK